MIKMKLTVLCLTLLVLFFGCKTINQRKEKSYVDKYNVVWETPSKDASGQMPLGNGDIAAGVYAIEDGDLYLLLSKNDAYTQHGDIFKTGRVRISLSPNPFAKGKYFRQTMDMKTGSVLFEADEIKLRVWADINPSVGVITKTGVNAMDIDYMVDLKEARNKIQRQICLRGNLSPMDLLEMSYDKLVEHCCQIVHSGEIPFVLSTGCLVARDTPKENIDAMVVASKKQKQIII